MGHSHEVVAVTVAATEWLGCDCVGAAGAAAVVVAA
eukprot:COSAG02_NODE_826_length_16718_cov_4813.219628_17_plen_36_part_00